MRKPRKGSCSLENEIYESLNQPLPAIPKSPIGGILPIKKNPKYKQIEKEKGRLHLSSRYYYY